MCPVYGTSTALEWQASCPLSRGHYCVRAAPCRTSSIGRWQAWGAEPSLLCGRTCASRTSVRRRVQLCELASVVHHSARHHADTFVLVGTKRASWFPASRQTWLLMTRAGLEALVADGADLTCSLVFPLWGLLTCRSPFLPFLCAAAPADASDRLLLTCCYIGGSAASLFLSGILSVPSGDWILTLGVVFW